MWLGEFLPEFLPRPRARIMTWGYNSNVRDGSSTATIHDFASRLLEDLVTCRSHGDEKRPIVFICHSLGGIVVKEVFVSSSTNLNMRFTEAYVPCNCAQALNIARKSKRFAVIGLVAHGIIFLATPHGGSRTAQFGSLSRMAIRALGAREDLIIGLRSDSEDLKRIQEEFVKHYDKTLEIATFSEKRRLAGPISSMGIVRIPSFYVKISVLTAIPSADR